MSRWSHVYGCFSLFANSESVKINKNNDKIYYIKYPKEQIEFGYPRIHDNEFKKSTMGLNVYVYSLPRVKNIIDDAFKLFPSGENLKVQYFLNQTRGEDCRTDSSSLAPFSNNEEQTLFKELKKRYLQYTYGSNSLSEFKKYNNFKFDWIHYINSFTLSICDDIRHCSGDEFFDAFEKFISTLCENEIYFESGQLTLHDEWSKFLYSIRIIDSYFIEFSLRDKKNNKIIAKKVKEYRFIKNDETKVGHMELVDLNKSKKWDELYGKK